MQSVLYSYIKGPNCPDFSGTIPISSFLSQVSLCTSQCPDKYLQVSEISFIHQIVNVISSTPRINFCKIISIN